MLWFPSILRNKTEGMHWWQVGVLIVVGCALRLACIMILLRLFTITSDPYNHLAMKFSKLSLKFQ